MLKIFNKIAAEEGIEAAVIQDAFVDMLKQIKQCMNDPELPKVLINGFGTFKVKPERLDTMIRSDISAYKHDLLTKEELKKKLEQKFKVRRRLRKEDGKARTIQRTQSNTREQVESNKGDTDLSSE
jgi:hypothetical protein